MISIDGRSRLVQDLARGLIQSCAHRSNFGLWNASRHYIITWNVMLHRYAMKQRPVPRTRPCKMDSRLVEPLKLISSQKCPFSHKLTDLRAEIRGWFNGSWRVCTRRHFLDSCRDGQRWRNLHESLVLNFFFLFSLSFLFFFLERERELKLWNVLCFLFL